MLMGEERKKSMVPKWRFPEFWESGEWKYTPLNKLAKRRVLKNHEGKVLRVLTNSAEHGVVDQLDYFDKDIAVQGNLKGYFVVKNGDFVYNPRISSFAPVGPISKNNIGTGVMSPLYTIFRFKVEDDFYAHYFKSTGWHPYMRQISSTGARHDRMAISKDDFESMPLPVAPMEKEQQKIADCLTSLDELITAEVDKLEAYKSHKRGLMQKLFPSEGKTVPEWRFPEFRGSGEWQKKEVGEVFNVTRGYVLSIQLLSEKQSQSTPYPVFSSQTKNNGLAGYYKDYLYENAITWTTDGANAGDVNYRSGKFYCTNVCGVLLNLDGFANSFTAALINSVSHKHVSYVGNPKLMNGVMSKIVVPFPSIKEQQCIADCLSSIDELISIQSQKIETLKTHKKGLMQGLFPSADEVVYE